MKYLKMQLPDGTLEVSKIILGTDYFGTNVEKETAFHLMDKFMEAGGNCLDTARIYAEWLPGGAGASERLIGEWLKSRKPGSRMHISTKGGHPPRSNMNMGRLSKACLQADLDDSLKALGVEYIDIYWLHRDDTTKSVEEIMDNINHVSIGKVRAIGCSNWRVDRIKAANAYALSKGIKPFSASQIQWSLGSSTPEAHDDQTIVCMDLKEYEGYLKINMPVFAFSSQAKGFFSTAAAKGIENINKKALARFCNEENMKRLGRVKDYSLKNNLPPSAAVLGYITCNELPAAAIVGCKNPDQLEDSLKASDVEISGSEVSWLLNG